MNILIVDDEIPAVQGILKIVNWQRIGIEQTFVAYSMDEAIGQFQARSVELLLTDIEMRGGTGFDLIEWANARAFQYVSIILSSFPNFHYAQRAIALGVFEYLLKPVEDSQLESTLSRAVAQVRQAGGRHSVARQTANALVERSKAYIYDHISQEISRNDIASHVGLSPEYLSTFFKKETGKTLSEFIKAERIAFAKRLLKQTNLPISMISDNVGFDSLSYFSSVFRSVAGCTPREYRQRVELRKDR